MIKKQDLLEAIAECQGTRNPNANTAIKLAAFYTILDHLDDDEKQHLSQERAATPNGYSFVGEKTSNAVSYDGTSEFAQAVNGKNQADVWPVLDELMSTVRLLNNRLYDNVMRNLQG